MRTTSYFKPVFKTLSMCFVHFQLCLKLNKYKVKQIKYSELNEKI